ncbi:ThiF family adenylyltransferase [Mycobacteroides abscessus]|uniref:ThiF family adenylyltransferase n=1 Tax=Mycobacteroides abscessus TaxID=36809 RepID=UPI00266BDD68|nr:ThiF family adenylyltransferase [Mycobacteroides abscessus]MDO3175906.1 ThiF family adenylyltransferase [Mycobacteroides abscessus subsp. abscessus]
MTDTPDIDHVAALAEERDAFRDRLVQRGFSDDGLSLQGPIVWEDGQHETHTSRVEVTFTERFPFAPPSVTILEAEHGFIPTFHIERDGKLCLWPNDTPVHDAPWRDPDAFIQKVSGWFAKTAMGWPGDEDADLERYLDSNDNCLVLYDDSLLDEGSFYRTSTTSIGAVTINDKLSWHPNADRIKNKGKRRKERNLTWVVDVGAISRPIRTWQDLQEACGKDCETARRLIEVGSLTHILVRYQRGTRRAALVVDFPRSSAGIPELRACEGADQSTETRTLRAGPAAPDYAHKKVAVVGCGAVGSHAADLLFRSGVRQLALVDPERYRPGNVIRHAADNAFVGALKVSAVKAQLTATGLDTDQIQTVSGRITDPDQALQLVRANDVIVDATADARATALLRWATEAAGGRLISVCIQRDGGIARVDRFPLQADETHLEPVPPAPGGGQVMQERGCGSPVSATPPLSVVKAATMTCQVALDHLDGAPSLAATILEVIEPQEDAPYNVVGILTS